MSAVEFYQSHLNRVSRSFAACIARLESPLRSWVSLTYLLCRILDTIEDASWESAQAKSQVQSFEVFSRLIGGHIQPEVLKHSLHDWVSEFPLSLPEGERLLLADAGQIFADLHAAPENVRSPIQELVNNMAAGMRHFSLQKAAGAQLRLRHLSEVNQYCFFVAGLVGETLSKLLRAVDYRVEIGRDLIVDAHHFGLFLQKINLLKDQFRDESEGRFLVPSRAQLLASLAGNAEGAMRYVEAIPVEHKDYRVFCAWSLFLGLATLPLLRSQTTDLAPDRLAREKTAELFTYIESWVDSPTELRRQFNLLVAPAVTAAEAVRAHASTMKANSATSAAESDSQSNWTWVTDIYRGLLSRDDFYALGLAE